MQPENPYISAAFVIGRNSAAQFVCFFGLLFVSGFFLTLVSRWTNNSFRQFRFPQFGLYVFGIVGIPVHEFCHALFAKIFFHEVKSIKWFDPQGAGGSHGSVVHYYNDKNLYHRIGMFFIGMGPVLLAPFFLYGAYYWLVPSALHLSWKSGVPDHFALSFLRSMIAAPNWHSWKFYFFLYFAACLTSQMELSMEDFKVARGGLIPFLIIVLCLNSVAYIFHVSLHAKLMSAFTLVLTVWSSFFVFALAVSLMNLISLAVILNLLNSLFGRDLINPFESPTDP